MIDAAVATPADQTLDFRRCADEGMDDILHLRDIGIIIVRMENLLLDVLPRRANDTGRRCRPRLR